MDLFVCSSMYQLFNSISLIVSNNITEADIIILGTTIRDNVSLEKLNETKIFRNVYYWNGDIDNFSRNSKNKRTFFYNTIYKVKSAIRLNTLMNTIPNKNKCYERIWIAYADFPSRCIYYNFKKTGSELFMFEDGLYSYECLTLNHASIKEFFLKALFKGCIFDECKKIYVHRPELLLNKTPSPILVEKIPPPTLRIRTLFFDLFPCGEQNPLFDKTYIMFDQYLEFDYVTDLQKNAVEVLSNAVRKEQFIIKLHPSTIDNPYNKAVNVTKSKIPFEVFMFTPSIQETVLISIFSSACFNPKLIMDKEPYIILLYKIVNLEDLDFFDSQYLCLINRVRKMYRHPEKIIIPNSLEELHESILLIKGILSH